MGSLFTPGMKIKSGYVISSLLLLLSYFLIFHSTSRLRKQSKWVAHSYIVSSHFDRIIRLITEAETSVRGYVITKDPSYLQLYYNAQHVLPDVYEELRQLTTDNPQHLKRLDTLEHLTSERLNFMTEGIDKFQEAGLMITPEMQSRRSATRANMDSIRLFIGKLSERENSLAQERGSTLSNFFNNANTLTLLSLFLAVIAIGYSLYTYSKENARKEAADRKAENYNRELEASVLQLRKLNMELEELRSIEQFAATGRVARTIAHEVRNPLTNITLASEQLQELVPPEGETGVLMSMIDRNSHRINQLVTELLNATKFAQLTLRKNDVHALLDETVKMAKDRIDLNQVQVIRNYSAEMDPVMVDADKMRIAFLNIIVNAIEAMEKGKGVLEIRTKKEHNKCVIEIRDNGAGMDETTLKNIFEPYFTKKALGNGLGLTNTQNVILNHKGLLKVSSRIGSGTIFTVILEMGDS